MRVGILPPGVDPDWHNNGVQMQALILAFDQVCQHDEDEHRAAMARAGAPAAFMR